MKNQSVKSSRRVGVLGVAAASLLVLAGPAQAGDAETLFSVETRKATRTPLTDTLSGAGYATAGAVRETNLSLNNAADQRTTLTAYLGGAVTWRPDAAFGGFVHGEIALRRTSRTGADLSTEATPRLREAFGHLRLDDDTVLSGGRMRLTDPNRWLLDGAVDGVHLGVTGQGTAYELSLGRPSRNDAAATDGLIAVAHAGVALDDGPAGRGFRDTRLGVIGLAATEGGDSLGVLAGYALTAPTPRTTLEIHGAIGASDLAGDGDLGAALDISGSWRLSDDGLRPTVRAGVAVGTAGMHLPGMESNKTKAGGQALVHSYGEVFGPSLTNVAVGYAGIGLRPSKRFSLDLTAYAYAQPVASTTTPDARVTGATTGGSAFLGAELDLVGAWRPTTQSKIEFGAGVFAPGAAFADDSRLSTRVFARAAVYF